MDGATHPHSLGQGNLLLKEVKEAHPVLRLCQCWDGLLLGVLGEEGALAPPEGVVEDTEVNVRLKTLAHVTITTIQMQYYVLQVWHYSFLAKATVSCQTFVIFLSHFYYRKNINIHYCSNIWGLVIFFYVSDRVSTVKL